MNLFNLLMPWLCQGYLLSLLLFAGCSKNLPVEANRDIPPQLSGLNAPVTLFNQSSTEFTISVFVDQPEDISSVRDVGYSISQSGATTVLDEGAMSDDGRNGDILANDRRYSALITGQFAPDSGLYVISVEATDRQGRVSEPVSAQVTITEGDPGEAPIISSVLSPTTVFADAAFEFVVEVEIADVNGLADIRRVWYDYAPPTEPNPTQQGELNDTGTNGDKTAGDGIYTVKFNNSLFAATADYRVRISAEDLAGNVSKPQVVLVRGRPERSKEPLISDLSAPELIILDQISSTELTFTLTVEDPQGVGNLDFVKLLITRPGGSADPGNPYLLENTGGNTFSQVYDLPLLSGEFRLLFQARDKDNYLSNKIEHSIAVTSLATPVISGAAIMPNPVDVIDGRDTTVVTTIQVSDPQGPEDIAWVRYAVFDPSGQELSGGPFDMLDDGSSGDQVAGDGIYSARFTVDAGETVAGDYRIDYFAKDQSDSLSNIVSRTMQVRLKSSPVISNLVAPDTVAIDPEQTRQILLSVDVDDAEGLENIDIVQFRSFLPGGNEAQESPFEMKDDGEILISGDFVKGDGTYSIIVNLPSQGVQPGDFTFIFMARDKDGLVSNEITHTMTVVQSPGGSGEL